MGRLYIDVVRVIKNTKTFGLRNTCTKLKKYLHLGSRHVDYNKWMHQHRLTDKERQQQREHKFAYQPKFSILVPLYESNPDFLRALIASVQAQTYENWELCFSDGGRKEKRLQDFLQPYMEKDTRIRYTALQEGTLGIAENTNQAYTLATGDYIVFGDHDDLFEADALYACVEALNTKRVQVIYTDEDKVDETGDYFFAPNFKPDFNIDLLRCNNYICHMFVAERTLAEQVGMLDPAYDGAQDYDFIFRCIEQADGIFHIPKILYHWRAHAASTAENPETKRYAFEAGKRAIEAHLLRQGLAAEVVDGAAPGYYQVSYLVQGEPLVSIVIPNKDHVSDLKKCIEALEQRSTYRNYEIVIVENNSVEQETFAYYKSLAENPHIQVLYWQEEFNYSGINNFGVSHTKGEYILLLNNDTELISPDFITQMLGYCQRKDVGIVGARLYFEDDTIQHAGVIVGIGGIAGHAFSAMDEKAGIYQLRTSVACDYSAVTAACLMVSRETFDAVGGLEPEFQVAFNDVDFCLKVRKLGKLVVYVPQAKLHHYESKSRGKEDTLQKQNRFHSEMQLFQSRWADILTSGDPYYNKNLALDVFDFSVRK